MCGITGVVATTLRTADVMGVLSRMVSALRHRGPDSNGIHVPVNMACGLGHARLSIIDLSQAASQPMQSLRGDRVLAFNGEVYNFQELRKALEAEGHVFRSRSDTEVVLAAYEHWGTSAFRRLNGMFALALMDLKARRMILVRDRLGIKPLFLSSTPKHVIFASEMKALLASGLLAGKPDWSHLHEYLYFGNTLGLSTMYQTVERVPPGHWVEVSLDTALVGKPVPYWSAQAIAHAGPQMDIEDAVPLTRRLLEDAVRRQLVSDVPLGVFLSGGVDSTAIVALATRHYGSKLRTYSVGFDYIGDEQELPKARSVAHHFGTEHHELQVSASNIAAVIEKVAAAHDQPFGDPANLPLFQLCEALNGETKVVLQGDGGDELFGGYRRYSYLRVGAPMRPLAWVAQAVLKHARASPATFGARRFFFALSQRQPALRMGLLLTVEGPLSPPARVLSHDMRVLVEEQDPFIRYRQVAALLPPTDELQQMLMTDMQILLPDIFLEKVDRSTMAASTEIRVPFLDFDLVDYVLSIPAALKVGIGARKKLLKQALAGIVPREILTGRKMGFGVPISAWMKGPLRRYAEDRILAHASPGGLFDRAAVSRLFSEHAAGHYDHGQLLWKVMQLAIWLDRMPCGPTSHAAI